MQVNAETLLVFVMNSSRVMQVTISFCSIIELLADKIISQIDVQQVVRMDYLVSAPEMCRLPFEESTMCSELPFSRTLM
jgi:hypothetical protein